LLANARHGDRQRTKIGEAMRILLVEDDRDIAQRLANRLALHGFVVEQAHDAETAMGWPDAEGLTALVVDIGLPGFNGIDLVRFWRSRELSTPILILTARGSWQEKVEGLNAGADDYVVKPVHAEEIAARLHALIRRTGGHAAARMRAGSVALDPSARAAWLDDVPLELTQTEYRLLHLFMLRPGHVLGQDDIINHLYPAGDVRDRNTVEVHIGRLRRKIGRAAIGTVRGLGYRLDA
jgi:two-component system, OmpR family, response regulator